MQLNISHLWDVCPIFVTGAGWWWNSGEDRVTGSNAPRQTRNQLWGDAENERGGRAKTQAGGQTPENGDGEERVWTVATRDGQGKLCQ